MYSSVFAPQAIQRNGVLEDLHDVGSLRSFWKTGGIGCFISPLAVLSVQIVKHLSRKYRKLFPTLYQIPYNLKLEIVTSLQIYKSQLVL